MPRLLVIDDRDDTIAMCHKHLPQFDYVTRCDRPIPCQVCEEATRGCPLRCAHDYKEAEEALAKSGALPDLVVLDLHFALPEERLLPEVKTDLPAGPSAARRSALEALRRRQGLLILDRLRQQWPSLPVVMLTTTDADLGEAPNSPLVRFCQHEIVDSRSLAAEIRHALVATQAAQEGPVFWGRSAAVQGLRRSIATLARSPLPVLIEGETGTGKSFLAEHVLHPRSGRKGPLVVTDLSTVPSSLLAAHLFGSRRGAYTGAVEDHAGVFEQAHGGTLFLDEIANLDLDVQRQLLLVLERGTVTRLGDARPRPAAPRLVAATNQPLDELVRQGRFRADLYMRLNPATRLRVPPLRERADDLPDLLRFALLEALRGDSLRPLVRAYLARFPTPEDLRESENQLIFGPPRAAEARPDAFTLFLGRRALERLRKHAWPGNQRELRLFATNALASALCRPLDALPLEVLSHEADARAPEPAATRMPAVVVLGDELVDGLLGIDLGPGVEGGPPREGAQTLARGASRRVAVDVSPGASFSRISREVERQYLRALYDRVDGDLERLARELLGPRATGRQVHVRLNQLGLRLRELRGNK